MGDVLVMGLINLETTLRAIHDANVERWVS